MDLVASCSTCGASDFDSTSFCLEFTLGVSVFVRGFFSSGFQPDIGFPQDPQEECLAIFPVFVPDSSSLLSSESSGLALFGLSTVTTVITIPSACRAAWRIDMVAEFVYELCISCLWTAAGGYRMGSHCYCKLDLTNSHWPSDQLHHCTSSRRDPGPTLLPAYP